METFPLEQGSASQFVPTTLLQGSFRTTPVDCASPCVLFLTITTLQIQLDSAYKSALEDGLLTTSLRPASEDVQGGFSSLIVPTSIPLATNSREPA